MRNFIVDIIKETFIWCLCILWALVIFAIVVGISVTPQVETVFPW